VPAQSVGEEGDTAVLDAGDAAASERVQELEQQLAAVEARAAESDEALRCHAPIEPRGLGPGRIPAHRLPWAEARCSSRQLRQPRLLAALRTWFCGPCTRPLNH
jgi:hypothetical protein